MLEMSKGTNKSLKYEDIVVSAFKKFGEDFHLRGYPEYPDSGDLVHKPLYEFRKRGFVEANNKVFSLTDRGIAYAEQLAGLVKGKDVESNGRLSRFAEKEISRIETSEGFSIFLNGDLQRITDGDFYKYFGVTPKTPKNEFLGRLETVNSAIKELGNQKSIPVSRGGLAAYHDFIREKFQNIISHFKSN